MEKSTNFRQNLSGSRILRTERGAIEIRKYSPPDFDRFYSLYARTFAEPPWNEKWTRRDVKKEVEGYTGQSCLDFLLAVAAPPPGSPKRRSRIVGASIAYLVTPATANWFPMELGVSLWGLWGMAQGPPVIYGDELAVDKSFRGLGIGTALMESRFRNFRDLFPARRVFVGRTDADSRMVSMYKRLGYANTGFRDPKYSGRYYFMKGEADAIGK